MTLHERATGWALVLRKLPAALHQTAVLLLCCLGAVAVGLVDSATGADIHVVSLYFVPLVLAGWQLSRAGAAAVALFSTCVWMAALYDNGAHHDRWQIWTVNFLTQGCAFLAVALLVSRLSQRLSDEQTLRRIDTLTGLMNRTGFLENAHRVLPLCRRHARPVCLAYIDLDHFKQANDRLGHDHGDSLLQQCGMLITHCIRASDVAGRLGGDEFVLLFPETDHPQAEEICQRVLRQLEAAADFRAAGVTASIGIVVDERARLDIAELLRRADAEMYRVKQAGRNAVATRQARPASGALPRTRTQPEWPLL
jgi:diguanylate cyclase (GGDEF)-like protein